MLLVRRARRWNRESLTNRNLLIRIALKATIILTFPKYTPVMLVQG